MPTENRTLSNGDTRDLFVSITDLNTAIPNQVWTDNRLNYHQSQDVLLEIDGEGRANIHWQARRVDAPEDTNEGDARPLQGETIFISIN